MKITDSDDGMRDIRKVIGANVKRLRTDARVPMEAFSKEAKRVGLPYSVGRVGDLEAGRVEAKFETMLLLTQLLANVTGSPVRLADLLDGDPRQPLLVGETVTPDDQINATPTEIARRLGWPDLDSAAADFGVNRRKVSDYLKAMEESGITERRAAKALGIDLAELTRHSVALWGVNLSTERDRLAEPGANVATVGQITRALRDEIEARL